MSQVNFTRKPEVIKKDWVAYKDDTIMTQKGCEIHIPSHYDEIGFLNLEEDITIIGYFAIIIDTYYGVSKAPALLNIEPDDFNEYTLEDKKYTRLIFDPGSVVISNKNVIKDQNLLFPIYDEFYAKGRIPWYFTYHDLALLFELSPHYTGVRLGVNNAVHELIVSVMGRQPNDLNAYYRQFVKLQNHYFTHPPEFIKLNSVSYGPTNTTAKIIGSYWEEGLMSALTNPSKSIEPIEELLRR